MCDLIWGLCDDVNVNDDAWHSFIKKESKTNGFNGYCTHLLVPKFVSESFKACKVACDLHGSSCLGFSYQHDSTKNCILSSTNCMEKNRYESIPIHGEGTRRNTKSHRPT